MNSSSKDPQKISTMFSSIAPRYDLLNRILSLGVDRYWRKFAVSQLPKVVNASFLDVATGTCDIALEIINKHRTARVTGIDFSEKMLDRGREKIRNAGLSDRITLRTADVIHLPFHDNIFDASIIAFGIRNVTDYKKGIHEMQRVVKSAGKVVILEFSNIQHPVFKIPYRFYISAILPFIGEAISGRKGAYTYLPASMREFPNPEELRNIMKQAGLENVTYHKLSFGITTVHIGTVP